MPPSVDCRLALVLPLLAGCYLAHEPEQTSDRACVDPGITGEACGAIRTATPDGICRMRDGRVVAFTERWSTASCGPSASDRGALEMVVNHCLGESPIPRAIECAGLPASGPIRVGSTSLDPPRGECALVVQEEAAGPYEPFDEATEVCVERPFWCGAPVVIELVQPDADGCGGDAMAERCRAFVDGSRIVLEAETAPARIDTCATVVGDRVARCVVRPLGAGTYDITLPDGRLLDVIEIGRLEWPPPERGRRCSPIPC